jgi:hypothetical protein
MRQGGWRRTMPVDAHKFRPFVRPPHTSRVDTPGGLRVDGAQSVRRAIWRSRSRFGAPVAFREAGSWNTLSRHDREASHTLCKSPFNEGYAVRSVFNEAMSMEKRYFTSDLSSRS